jgi:hypothetical protein
MFFCDIHSSSEISICNKLLSTTTNLVQGIFNYLYLHCSWTVAFLMAARKALVTLHRNGEKPGLNTCLLWLHLWIGVSSLNRPMFEISTMIFGRTKLDGVILNHSGFPCNVTARNLFLCSSKHPDKRHCMSFVLESSSVTCSDHYFKPVISTVFGPTKLDGAILNPCLSRVEHGFPCNVTARNPCFSVILSTPTGGAGCHLHNACIESSSQRTYCRAL